MLNRNVLILNQNYEPLTVCSVKRAVVMMLLGKVEMIETLDGHMLHSVSAAIRVPSVVRLGFYVKVPRKRIFLSRKNIIKRDGHKCMYCGRTDGAMTVDHVVPKRMGGKDTWENLVCACTKCNNRKGDRTPEQANMTLIKKPKKPNHLMFIQRFIGISDDNWKPYLFMEDFH
ncbi:MAG: HNH endonuclease [candidate division Zixibacteria bacterium]|nr:HNH endonuclease [candidate division Zixibacteria bacterium]